jgi:subtilisin family serine protease
MALPPSTTGTSDPDINNATGMTGANIARSELGLTGDGVTIAVIDSGLDAGPLSFLRRASRWND